jgi:predicted acyltransferase (DUF342 family)
MSKIKYGVIDISRFLEANSLNNFLYEQIRSNVFNVTYLNSGFISIAHNGQKYDTADHILPEDNVSKYVLDVNGSSYFHNYCKINNNLDVIKNLNVKGTANFSEISGNAMYTTIFNSSSILTNNIDISNVLNVYGVTSIYDNAVFYKNTDMKNLNLSKNLNVSENTYIVGTLKVDDNVSFYNNLNLSNNFYVGGNTNLLGKLNVSNNVSIYGDTDISGKLFVDNILLSNNLDVLGQTTLLQNVRAFNNLDVNGTLTVNSNTSIGGDVNISSNINIKGRLDLSGNAQIAGNLNVSGINPTGILSTFNKVRIGTNIDPLVAIYKNAMLNVSSEAYIDTLFVKRITIYDHFSSNAEIKYNGPTQINTGTFTTLQVFNSSNTDNSIAKSNIFIGKAITNDAMFNDNEAISLEFNTYGNFMHGIYNVDSNEVSYFDLNANSNTTKGGIGIRYTGPVKFVTTNMSIDGNLNITGNIYSYSDKTIKDNITKLENCLNKLNNITGYSFTRKDLENISAVHIGLLAQEVEEMFPEIVNNTTNIKSINYNSMIAVIIESIKELNKKINQLKTEINQLKF